MIRITSLAMSVYDSASLVVRLGEIPVDLGTNDGEDANAGLACCSLQI